MLRWYRVRYPIMLGAVTVVGVVAVENIPECKPGIILDDDVQRFLNDQPLRDSVDKEG